VKVLTLVLVIIGIELGTLGYVMRYPAPPSPECWHGRTVDNLLWPCKDTR